VALGLVGAIGPVVFAILFLPVLVKGNPVGDYFSLLFVCSVFLIGLVYWAISLIRKRYIKCPACGRYVGKNDWIARTLIKENLARRTIHNPGVFGSLSDRTGHLSGFICGGGSTSQLVVKVEMYREDFRCPRCGCEWEKVVEEEYDNYDL
jgi:hypothetical protein